MDRDSLVYHIKTHDFYKDIAGDMKTRFDTSAYSKNDDRPLLIGKNKKVVGLMKFVALTEKLYAYTLINL